ncbi:MAG: OTU domain-containing protein [Gammaproteobacteria bacterium]
MSDKTITIPGITGQNESFVWEEVSDKSGNCFYESIAHLIKGDSRRCGSIRADISQYIYNHWDVFKDFISDEDFKKAGISLKKPVDVLKNSPDQAEQEYLREKYKDLINTRGVWGDSTSIKAASEVFKVNIVIVKENGEKNQQYPDPNNSNLTYRKTIYLRYQGGNHYQPLINLKEKTAKIWAANIPDDAILTSLAREQIVGILLITDKKKLEAELFEYLRTKSDEELKKFYISILKFSKPKEETVLPKKKQPELSETFSGIFESFASLFSNPVFIESLTKLFAGFRTIFHKIMVAFNPGAEFDESEKEGPYGQYVKIFSLAGEAGRKLYRKLLKKINNKEISLTNEQFLNVLLHKLKKDTKGLFSKVGHAVVTKIEKEIFKDLKEKEDQSEQLAVIVEENLRKGYQAYLKAYPPQEGDDPESWNNFENLFEDAVQIIKGNVSALKNEIDKLIDQIKDPNEGLSDKQKVELWAIIQQDRLKLSHFVLKTKAFSEGSVLTPKKKQEFGLVFENFLHKFNTQSIIDIHSAGDRVAVVVPEEERKSILRLFVNGNKYDCLVSEDNFTEALRKAKESRSEEIKQAIEIQNNQMTMALESLRDVDLPEELQDGVTERGLNQRLRGLKILDEVGDSLDVNAYNGFKQKLTDNAQKLTHLEKLANPWVNKHNVVATAADPVQNFPPQHQFIPQSVH